MTNPAEKIRQVVEEGMESVQIVCRGEIFGVVHAMKEHALKDCTVSHTKRVIDMVVAGMEHLYLESEKPDNGPWDYGYRTALHEQIKSLKEARTSITNNHD